MASFTHHDIHSQSKKVIYQVYVFLKKLSTMDFLYINSIIIIIIIIVITISIIFN